MKGVIKNPVFPVKNYMFWFRWLQISAVFITLFGLLMTTFNHTSAFSLMNRNINSVFFNSDTVGINIQQFQGWVYGVTGAVMAGWGIMLFCLITNAFRDLSLWSWYCILVSLLVWYVADTLTSALYKVTFNVVLNTVLLIIIFLPLVLTRKYFSNKKKL
ncbi:MAG: hypothetical protein JXJ22_18705 [Bacteroidales bacterium]|nr:hypothetical protein [Bacteroidales bacterium]